MLLQNDVPKWKNMADNMILASKWGENEQARIKHIPTSIERSSLKIQDSDLK